MILIIIIMHHNHHWIIIIINIIIIIINHNHPHAHPHPHYIMAVSRLQHHLMRLSDQDLPGLEHQMWESCNAIMAASWTPCELVFLWLVSFHPCSHLRYQQKRERLASNGTSLESYGPYMSISIVSKEGGPNHGVPFWVQTQGDAQRPWHWRTGTTQVEEGSIICGIFV